MDLTDKQIAEIRNVFSQMQLARPNGTVGGWQFGPAIVPASGKRCGADPEEHMRETFMACDLDGDGFLSAAELQYMMEHVGELLTDEEVNELLREADCDGDGRLSYQEFKDMME